MKNEKEILDALPGTLDEVAYRTSLSCFTVHDVLVTLLHDGVVNIRQEQREPPYTSLVYYVPEDD